MENKKNKKKQGLLAVLGLFGILLITVGVTYAFFSYTRSGSTENSITSGNISFLYTENTKIGKGIMLQDAIPMTDAQGKIQSGEGKVFEFSITSKTGTSIAVPYEVTARMSSDSTLDPSVVKLYLEKGNEEVLLEKYSELPQTSNQSNYTEKVIYNGKVPRGSSNYSESFKLRMWIDEETEYSQVDVTKYYCDGTEVSQEDYNTCSLEKTTQTVKEYPYNDKLFKITVNVYANGKMLTEEDLNLEKSTGLTTLSVNNGESLYQDGVETYTTSTRDSSITLNVVPKNIMAKVTVTKTDSTYTNAIAMNDSGVLPISAVNRTYTLTTGEHYFKIVVEPEDSSVASQEYHLQVTKLPGTVNTLSSLSIADCPLNESFDPTIDTYTCTTDKSSLTVSAETTDSGATYAVNGNTGLNVGTNTITVIVTPEDTSVTKKTYTITATKATGPFATDSWATIIANVRAGNVARYAPTGDGKANQALRPITLGNNLGTHYLRVANTTPCTNGETSETACGFVIEFADIISERNMNDNLTNQGGYPGSDLFAYINDTLLSSMPEEIRNIMIPTTVVSSHGTLDSSNFVTQNQYLYLFDRMEVLGVVDNLYSADNTTRQLDFYSLNGGTDEYSDNRKKANSNGTIRPWWLRSTRNDSNRVFDGAGAKGDYWRYNSDQGTTGSYVGLSPAFRIG